MEANNKSSRLRARILMIAVLTISFGVLTVLARNNSLAHFENDIYSALSRYISPAFTSIMIVITNMGMSLVIISVAVILLAIPSTRINYGIPVAVNAALSAGLNSALKRIIARDRPGILRLVTETGYGFPSGHTMNSTALCVIILLIVFRRTKSKKIRIPVLTAGIAMPLLIGISRIYLGVHNAGDVLAGWVMGVAVALLTDTAYVMFQTKRQKSSDIQSG